MVARHAGRAERQGQRDRQQVQREPDRIQGGAGQQGQLRRNHGGRHRGLPCRRRAGHPAGIRSRHRHHDERQGRDQAGVDGDEGRRREVRPEGLYPGGGGLLHLVQGRDAVVPVQQLDHCLLLQQGRLQEGGPVRAAQDLARSDAIFGQVEGIGHELRLYHRLAGLGTPGKLLGLA
ncbi:hypothetical protein D3C72_1362850 [compost metagenome]